MNTYRYALINGVPQKEITCWHVNTDGNKYIVAVINAFADGINLITEGHYNALINTLENNMRQVMRQNTQAQYDDNELRKQSMVEFRTLMQAQGVPESALYWLT